MPWLCCYYNSSRPGRLQEALLLGDLHLSERRMRALAAGAVWEGAE